MSEDPDGPAWRERAGRGAALAGLAAVPVVSLMCCVPGTAVLGQLDANCGADFERACLDTSQAVFTVWPYVTGGVAFAAFLARAWIPRRKESLRLVVGAFVVAPPLVNVLVAVAEFAKAS
ncbi:hypothetical protein [Actinoplanes rectilineatus]|uniref:hypothetical protein n=1 Tax=Actinoplanes rectilineatus TaxID=113571 RepID=UPI0005F2E049|nr:hypothetical protein [Actinoplanes rectilineatus]